LLCLYTDGVTEAESPHGEQFGEERLATALRDVAAKTPRQITAAIEQEVRTWCGDREPGDDLTLVVLRILG
jgi:sigma-B regulation protein RsbU (phosphoserine phosphatase)